MKIGTTSPISQRTTLKGSQHLNDLQRIRRLFRNADTLTQTTIIELFKNHHRDSSFEVTARLLAATAKCSFFNVIALSIIATPFWAILKVSDIFNASFKYIPIASALFYLKDVSKPLCQVHAIMQNKLSVGEIHAHRYTSTNSTNKD